MKKLGLIGYPLSHSFSAKYFNNKFIEEGIKDYEYKTYPLESIASLQDLLKAEPELIGLNVTIPYKEAVIKLLDELDDRAAKIGAVNVIKINQGRLKGFNTDYLGFKKSLHSLIPNNFNEKALIMGTGGASKAVRLVLENLGIAYQHLSRSAEKGITYEAFQKNPDQLKAFKLLINCTPLGTYPNIEQKPNLPYEQLTSEHYLFDLVYNPKITAFLQSGLDQGAKVINGYDMLVGQAEAAWEIWQKE